MTDTATETFNPAALSEAELRGILIEFGLMKERERRREQEEAEAAAKLEAEKEAVRQASLEAYPFVTFEWTVTPQEYSCDIAGKQYRGRGPLKDAAGRKVKPGSRQQIRAPHAVVLEEGGMGEIVDGREHCEGMWSPLGVMPGVIDNTPAPGNSKAWEDLAVG